MTLILVIHAAVVIGLVAIATTRGLERALPFFVFVTVLVPPAARIELFGLFALSAQRVAVITLVALYVLCGGSRASGAPLRSVPLRVLLAIHVLWLVLSSLDSVSPGDSLKKASYEAIEFYLMYYVLTKSITQLGTIRKLMRAMVFALTIACVLGVFEAYTSWRVAYWFPAGTARFSWASDFGHRYYSTFAAPHLFGAAIACGVVDALYLLTVTRHALGRLYLWLALLVMVFNVYKVVTRGPWLALPLGCSVLFVLGDTGTRRRLGVVAASAVIVLATWSGVRQTVTSIYQETADTQNANDLKAKSYEYRYALWGVATRALDRSASRQILGYGLETFYLLHLKAPFYTNPAYPFESCDSSWIELMTETGYVGLLIILALLFKPLILIIRDALSLPEPDRLLPWVLLINAVQYYFMMTNVALYGWGQTGSMLWIWIAMAMVYKPVLERENHAGADGETLFGADRVTLVTA